jgi:hypothetical protein
VQLKELKGLKRFKTFFSITVSRRVRDEIREIFINSLGFKPQAIEFLGGASPVILIVLSRAPKKRL